MARGRPDYMIPVGGITPESFITYSQVSPPILMFDDFESTTFKWISANGTISRDTTSATGGTPSTVFEGDACMKLVTDVESYNEARRYIPFREALYNIGISFVFYAITQLNYLNSNIDQRLIAFKIYDGTNYKHIIITYNFQSGNWYYMKDEAETSTLIGKAHVDPSYYNYVKLVVDLNTNYCKYLIVNATRLDMSDVPLFVEADTSTQTFYLWIKITAAASKTATIYIDNYKVTYNEP